MKKVLLSLVLGVTVSMVVGCAGNMKTFKVRGTETELAKMRGTWSGEYESADTGRTGSIYFDLELGRSIAEGEVEMNVPGEAEPRVVLISSMHVDDNVVKGRLARYTDPSCDCEVDAEFVGTLTGDEIDGTFTMRPVGKDLTMTGVWHATRVKR